MNPPPSLFPLIELHEDQSLQLFNPPSQAICPILLNPTQDQGGSYYREIQQQQQDQQEVNRYVLHGGSSDHQLLPSSSLLALENDSNNGLKLSISKKEEKDDGSVKWMSSKMKLMQKMMNSDQMGIKNSTRSMQKFQDPFETENSGINSSCNSNNIIRVCADCNTTKTPLWRSGPRGPKSLCNACGIRQRKARRAMAAAASGTILSTGASSIRSKVHHKEKRSDSGYIAQCKRKCKFTSPSHSRKKLCFEDFTISSSKNFAFHQVFPQDEKEAAILLMALSCHGLLRRG